MVQQVQSFRHGLPAETVRRQRLCPASTDMRNRHGEAPRRQKFPKFVQWILIICRLNINCDSSYPTPNQTDKSHGHFSNGFWSRVKDWHQPWAMALHAHQLRVLGF